VLIRAELEGGAISDMPIRGAVSYMPLFCERFANPCKNKTNNVVFIFMT